MNPKVVHCKKDKFDVYIGRPSKWGNPFKVGIHGVQGECVKLYREWICKDLKLLKQAIAELKGKVLGCWCAPKPCHGNVLADLANGDWLCPNGNTDVGFVHKFRILSFGMKCEYCGEERLE